MKNLLLFISTFTFVFTGFSQPLVQWQSHGVGGGGAMYSPAVSPHNPDELWISCDMSPMHRSNDFGDSYSTIPFQNLTGNRNSLIQFSSDPLKIYSLHLSTTGTYTLVMSSDGGSNWNVIPNSPAVFSAYRLYADAHQTGVMLLSDKNNIYFTDDEGANWTTIYTDNAIKGLHLAGVFWDGNDIYVCTNKGLIISNNSGANWSTVPSGISSLPSTEEIISFKAAKEGGNIRFFCVTLLSNYVTPRGYASDLPYFVGVYKLQYGQSNTWENLTTQFQNGNNLNRAYHLAMVEDDTSAIYVGGQTYINNITQGQVFKTTNGGTTFSPVFMTLPMLQNNTGTSTGWFGTSSDPTWNHKWNGINTIEGLGVDPNNINRVVRTDKSLVIISEDGGATWHQAYTKSNHEHASGTLLSPADVYETSGLEVTVYYWFTWLSQQNIVASCNDILSVKSTDAGISWAHNYSGLASQFINDINMILKQPVGSVLYAAAGEVAGSNGDYSDGRVALTKGRISFSTDNSQTWQTLHNFGKSVSWITFDPGNSNRMYATVIDTPNGSGGIFVCNDISQGSSSVWTTVPNNVPPRTEARPVQIEVLNDGSLVAVFGPRDPNPSPTFQFTSSSGVFYSTDGGNTWADRTHLNMQKATTGIAIDPNDPLQNTWLAFVTSQGTLNPGIYRTTDRGQNWTQIFNMPSYSCTFHPSRANEMYICTEKNGLYYATATNTNSPTFLPDNNFPFRAPIRAFFNPYDETEIWVGTFGNGILVGQESLVTGGIAQEMTNTLTLFPNPASTSVTMDLEVNSAGKYFCRILDGKGLQVYGETISLNKGRQLWSVMLDKFSSGIYFIQLTGAHESFSGKIMKE